MIAKSYEVLQNISKFLNYNMFLFYGENFGLKNEIQQLIKNKIKQEDSKVEYLSLYENDITENKENFYNTIYSGSLFSNKKVIIIKNCTDKIINQMEELSEKKLEGVLVVISADVLDKKSKLRNLFEKNTQTLCVPCYADNTRDLELVALKILKENNITASKEIINLLIEKSNNDRGNLHNEIEKIKSFAVDKKKLEIDEIKSIINFSGEYKSDSLINECLCGNILQYKKILSEIYSNTINQIFLLRILSNKIHKLLSMKEVEKNYSNIDNLLSASRPPIFWKDKPIVKKQLTIWNFNDLKKINNEIDNTELLCKKNPQLSKVIFFTIFTKIRKKVNSFS